MAEAVSAGGGCGSAPPDSCPGEEYECKICYNYFDLERRTPKLLGCSHTFCQECLDALHSREGRGWRLGCPLCRHRTPVPEYLVHNLPDNTALTDALPLPKLEPGAPCDPAGRTPPSAPSAPPEGNASCQTCKQVAFTVSCVCAILSFLSMVLLLFLGLIFVHNFNSPASHVGPVCLFVASVLALLSLILTWLMCLLRHRPDTETEASNSSLT